MRERSIFAKVKTAPPPAPISMLKGQLVLTRLAVGDSRAKFNIEFGGKGARKNQHEDARLGALLPRIGCERRKPQHNFGKTGQRQAVR